MPVTTLQNPTEHIEFSPHHQCDQCGSQAYVQVFFSENYLLFCAHHYRKNEDALNEKAKYVYDRRDLLENKPPHQEDSDIVE